MATEVATAQQIEILRGASTLRYGQNAVGGVVNVYDDRIPRIAPEDGLDAEIFAGYSTVDDGYTVGGSADVSATDNLVFHIEASDRDSDEYDIDGFASEAAEEEGVKDTVENSQSEATSGAAGLSWIGDRGYIGFAVGYQEGTYGLPGGKKKNSGGGGSLGVTYAAGESAKFDVTTDLLEVVKDMRKRNVPTFADGYYRCIVDPTAMMHLRQNSDFREIARYPGAGVINPMNPIAGPSANYFQGMGPAYGQAGFVAGQPVMPIGFLFEGVRWFESTNLPAQVYNLVITDANAAAADYDGAQLIFFGPQAVGVGIGGNNAQILLNNNDDFSRFIIMIWSLFAGFETLNKDFITVGYSFVY